MADYETGKLEAGAAPVADTLSDVLRAVRLSGAVFFSVEASAPWVAETPPGPEIAPFIMSGVEHVIDYHVVRAGSCWGAIADGQPIRLAAGDVIVFPHGSSHCISSAPGMRAGGGTDWPGRQLPGRIPVSLALGERGGEHAEVICGFLGCDARPFNPLLATLPPVIHVPRGDADDRVLEQLVDLALSESRAQRDGGECVLARLSELLFIEVVRRHLASLPPESVGWLAGLRDESIGRALGKLHHRPTHDWSLEELARQAGVSRSVLAERFVHFVGVPPMQYLAQWRMQLAANLLSTTSLGLAEIAERVGYGSEAALSRAYKRYLGVAPTQWRQRKRGAAA